MLRSAYVRPVSTFLKWAERNNREGASGARPTTPQRPKLRKLEVLSREEIDRIEAAAKWERDKLIIRLLADTGCRRGEVLGLTPNAIKKEVDGYFVYLRKPGRISGDHTLKGHERKVPIERKMYRRLQEFIRGLPPGREGGYIFLAERERWAPYKTEGERTPLRGDSLTQMVRYAAKHAGITRRVYPHLFRHSFISHCWNQGVQMLDCARWVGHEDLEMIQRYYGHPTDRASFQAMVELLSRDSSQRD